ncbi:MAG TPA: hypothetical protein GX506_09870 [Firmicutes bacterium]|nr:hypothetical protein [Bacillota bacterium]
MGLPYTSGCDTASRNPGHSPATRVSEARAAGASEGMGAVFEGVRDLHVKLGHLYLEYAIKSQEETDRAVFVKKALDAFSSAKELGAGGQACIGMSKALIMGMRLGPHDPLESKWMVDRAICEAEEAVAADPGNEQGHWALAEALMTKALKCPDAEPVSLIHRAALSAEVARKLKHG